MEADYPQERIGAEISVDTAPQPPNISGTKLFRGPVASGTEIQIFVMAVVPIPGAGDTRPDIVGDRPAHRALQHYSVISPVKGAPVSGEGFGRGRGDEVDQAAGRIPSEQRSLRTSQNL